MEALCNKDCLNCPFEDCVNDRLDFEDYKHTERIEKDILFPRTLKQRKLAAQQRAYYEANKDNTRLAVRAAKRSKTRCKNVCV